MIPQIKTDLECMSTMIPTTYELLQKENIPPEVCTLLIKIEEANIPQKGTCLR
jgi:hypothetical protein